MILWGPLVGRPAGVAEGAFDMAPLAGTDRPPALVHPVRMAVRRDEAAWRDLLDRVLAENAGRIRAVLEDHGIPLAAGRGD